MQIDWTTFALEIVNFLALVWILQRFLYAPVRDVLARRRAAVEQELADTREQQAQAQRLRSQFENRLAAWDEEKLAQRARLDREIDAERTRRLRQVEEALERERERSAAQDAQRREELRHELEARALAQAQRFAAGLLARLASEALEARLIELFIEDLARLPEGQVESLRHAAAAPQACARVATAFVPSEDQRGRIAGALAARLGRTVSVDFTQDPALVAGLQMLVGPWRLEASIAGELALFAQAANHAG